MKTEFNPNENPEEIIENQEKREDKKNDEYNFWKETWKRLRRHRMAMIGGTVIIIIYILVIFAGFLSPYHPHNGAKKHFFHPPTKVHFTDDDGLTRPYVYRTESVGWAEYEVIKDKKYPVKFFYHGDEYEFLNLFKTDLHLFGVDKPANIFLLGSDNYGRDVFTRLLFGGRVSMFIGFIAIFISTVIGLLVGGIAGYYGGWIDNVLMRLAEVVMSIPSFYLLLALAAVLPLDVSSTFRFFLIITILSFIGWAGMSRVIRGMVLSVRNEEYILAAQALGAKDKRIIIKHVLPSTATYVIVRATVAIPGYIIMESGLSFLGLGIQEPNASWGNMLTAAQNVTKITGFPWLLIPGVMIFIAVLNYNLLGDGLRDALDPKSTNDH
ncbi:MAG TPA: ABC transporter permease [Halanaerobiales bacterium]|nr:ABC transporter permease [Halanaerobiales bacterium]